MKHSINLASGKCSRCDTHVRELGRICPGNNAHLQNEQKQTNLNEVLERTFGKPKVVEIESLNDLAKLLEELSKSQSKREEAAPVSEPKKECGCVLCYQKRLNAKKLEEYESVRKNALNTNRTISDDADLQSIIENSESFEELLTALFAAAEEETNEAVPELLLNTSEIMLLLTINNRPRMITELHLIGYKETLVTLCNNGLVSISDHIVFITERGINHTNKLHMTSVV